MFKASSLASRLLGICFLRKVPLQLHSACGSRNGLVVHWRQKPGEMEVCRTCHACNSFKQTLSAFQALEMYVYGRCVGSFTVRNFLKSTDSVVKF